jgi:hypothetical protein
MGHEPTTLGIIRDFLAAQEVETGPKSVVDLFPPRWKVAATEIPLDPRTPQGTRVIRALPRLEACDKSGNVVTVFGGGQKLQGVVRLKPIWRAQVDLVADVLSAVKGEEVTREPVILLAQQSPRALEILKNSVQELKEHFNRLLDPVALRRDPSFAATAQQFKSRIRAIVDRQRKLLVEVRSVNRELNAVLRERNEKLSKLDPEFKPKRVSATAVLAGQGITLEWEEPGPEPEPLEGELPPGFLDDL